MRPDGRRHTLKDLYHEDTYFDFLSRRWRWALLSGVLIAISIAGFVLRDGLNLGLDFTGGTSWQLTAVASEHPSTGDVRDVVSRCGHRGAEVVIAREPTGCGSRRRVVAGRARRRPSPTRSPTYGGRPRRVASASRRSGPSWGEQVSREALLALVFFFVAIALYLSLRFEFKMAMAAIVAVIHDIVDHRRRLRGHRLRGHAGDRHRVPDDPGVLPLRHRRRVRQDQGEHAPARRRSRA